MECSIDGCQNQVHSKGLCQNHYRQAQRRLKDPLVGTRAPGPKPKRDWAPSRPKSTDEHCANGHPWNEHTILISDGKRFCRYCSYLLTAKRQGYTFVGLDEWILYRERRTTHCKQGHRWDEHGVKDKKGHWRCRKCHIDTRRRSLYGIEPTEYDAFMEKQDGKCPGCLVDLDLLSPRDISIDHCHSGGHVRGILCIPCNFALGQSKDNPGTLRRLADYLDSRPE